MTEHQHSVSAEREDKGTATALKLSIGEALLLTLIVLICSQGVAGMIMMPSFFYKSLTNILLPLGYLLGYGSALLVIFLWKEQKFNQWKDYFRAKEDWLTFLIGFLFLGAVAFFSQILTAQIPTQGVWILEKWYEFMVESFVALFDYKIAAVLTVSILAPIFEEWLFRGVLLRGLLQKGMAPWLAIGISALSFGLVHLNPWQTLNATLLGIGLGIIYYRSGSLILCIVLHFINNAVASVEMLQTNDLDVTMPDVPFWYFPAGLTASVILYFVFKSYTKKVPQWS